MKKHFFTPSELASRWQVTTMTLRRWRKDGKLKASHFGRKVRFSAKDILEFEASSNADLAQKTTIEATIDVPDVYNAKLANVLEMTVDSLELPQGCINSIIYGNLLKVPVLQVKHLITIRESELMRLRNFGKTRLALVKKLLQRYGLRLGMQLNDLKQAYSGEGSLPTKDQLIQFVCNCIDAEPVPRQYVDFRAMNGDTLHEHICSIVDEIRTRIKQRLVTL